MSQQLSQYRSPQGGRPAAADVQAFKEAIEKNLERRQAKDPDHATRYDYFLCAAYALSDHLVEHWVQTQRRYHQANPKRVYYLSLEYLLGRSLGNSLINLGLYDTCKEALAELDLDLDEILEAEMEAGLGNGGLGRLAACFLDSMATLGIPAHGYGIRYDFGLFHQKIVDGRQVETPDHWLALPCPWEVARPATIYHVQFGGRTCRLDTDGHLKCEWTETAAVLAAAYDVPIPGYQTETVNTLRLWTARATEEFNLEFFNNGEYISAVENKIRSENITRVLYPKDDSYHGKELRVKQEYFLVSASMQDIVARFKRHNTDWKIFPDKVAIQLNDTHPALAIPELLRMLIDEEGLTWETAWALCVQTFAYTNHTILPEALEEWPVSLLERLLPRHMEIIYLINHHFLRDVARRYPGDVDRLNRMSIIAEGGEKRVRMAFLAVVGSHMVNGVAELHSRLLREKLLADFAEFFPDRFTNRTNGITPRRWLRKANPALSSLITEAIGDEWIRDLDRLRALEPLADDASFQQEWRRIKTACKTPIINRISREHGLLLRPDSIFDVQTKRIHLYKRQLLFALYIVASYLRIKENPTAGWVPRTCIIGGKAAPGYYQAKLVIHLLNRIAEMVNSDPEVRDLLRVVFLPNYCVSLAEQLIPAANLSEQISTAGREASGTGNMKFALNGALTIGTLDGANVEILEEVGAENIFIFGLNVEQVTAMRAEWYDPSGCIAHSRMLQRVMQLLECDFFCPGEPGLFRPFFEELVRYDEFFLMADFDAYLDAQDAVSAAFRDETAWTRKSILNVARCGKFSSDRTIAEYASGIWHASPCLPPSEIRLPEELIYT